MIVSPASAEKATCPVAGCGCAQRAPRYPSDMTDAEWEGLGPQARAVMAGWGGGPGGGPGTHHGECGGGKKIRGPKRAGGGDSSGWLLAVRAPAANVQDRDAGHRL